MAKQANVIAHWHQLFENFQASSVDFYASIEKAVAGRFVPEAHWSRVEHKESGLASARREYLRMHRGKHAFDICAAPFGNGFFVSWWFTEPPLKYGFLYTLVFLFAVFVGFNVAYGIGASVGAGMSGIVFGAFLGLVTSALGVPAVLWFLGNAVRSGAIQGESTLLAMPMIGPIYEWVFAPETYYAMDTALMFQDAIHNAVLEIVDGMTAQKGVRSLTEAERKPVMKRFSASA